MSTTMLAPATSPAPPLRYSPVARISAAVFAFGAGAIHLAVAPEHFQEYLLFGIFFSVSGLAQLVAGFAILVRPTRRLLLVTAAATAAVVLLWLTSRTIGLPLGPE